MPAALSSCRKVCPLLYQQLRPLCGAQQQQLPKYQSNMTADKQQCSHGANASATPYVTARSLARPSVSVSTHQNALLVKNSYSKQGLPRQHAGCTNVSSQQGSFWDKCAAAKHRSFTDSSTCNNTKAGSIGGWSSAPNSITQSAHLSVVEDTLKLAALLRRFRDRGHLIAQLDPLKRTGGGPWLGPIGDEYTRYKKLLRLACYQADVTRSVS